MFVHPPDQAPPERGKKHCSHGKGPREPVGSRLIVPRGASETGFSWTRGPPVGGPSSGCPSRLSGRRRGLGGPETCLAVGRCEFSPGQLYQARRPALFSERRTEICGSAVPQAWQWRPGAGPQPAGITPAFGWGFASLLPGLGKGSGGGPAPGSAQPRAQAGLHRLLQPPGERGLRRQASAFK